MDVFSWLLVGHLVGDWLLQNKWIADGKQQGPLAWPLHLHCLVYTAVMSITAGIAVQGTASAWLGVSVAFFASHWLIDGFNLSYWWGRWTRQSDTELVRMGVDQTMHLTVLAGVAHWLGG